MKEMNFLLPSQISEYTIQAGVNKASQPTIKLLILGILAGAFIAFAAEGSNMAAYNLLSNPDTYGLGRALAGALFGTGLMLVIISGGELFTGNTMMVVPLLRKEIQLIAMLRNWIIVYIGNFVGSLFIAFMITNSGLLSSSNFILGGMTIKIATYKLGLSFPQAFFLGVMCNWLVCSAVWMSNGAKDIAGKIAAVFFPIWLFITSGFEHCIANMYYIPAAILAKEDPNCVIAASSLGVQMESLDNLSWSTFVLGNLFPVTLGNIVGGSVFVGIAYYLAYSVPMDSLVLRKRSSLKGMEKEKIQFDFNTIEQSARSHNAGDRIKTQNEA